MIDCPAIKQAVYDLGLPPTARLMMLYLPNRLNLHTFVEVKAESIAAEMQIKDTTAGQMLTVLVHRGYLEESGKRKPRAFRLPWSRHVHTERAA